METQTLAILIAFAAVMLTLAGMILATLRGMRSEMRARLDVIDSRLAPVEHGQAHPGVSLTEAYDLGGPYFETQHGHGRMSPQ